ncbi:MAG: hypothetical protein A2V73_07180 [candidate division Zixibacteria bacterium RBG_19FT_COMBO_42_43]|nr:MAG: hypothetical protein A2V73_07180 [candidate division Zixibacteria bacterium RBG_19FT_COMBO_42_43]
MRNKMKFHLLLFLIFIFPLISSELFGREIEKIASFEAWRGEISVGNNGLVRVISDMGTDYMRSREDTLATKIRDPGWKGEYYSYEDYKWNGSEYKEIYNGYTDNVSSVTLSGDTIDPRNGVNFDVLDLRISPGLSSDLLSQLDKIKYFERADVDCDGKEEKILVFTEKADRKAYPDYQPIILLVYELVDNKAVIEYDFRIADGAKGGPLEIRDVTQDSCPEIILHIVWVGGSGYTDEVLIFGVREQIKKKKAEKKK